MKNKNKAGFWEIFAGTVLRNRILILIGIGLFTVFMVSQWKNIKFAYTEANLLPDDDVVNVEYNHFLEKFGDEGNLIIVGVKDKTLFTPKNFIAWNNLMNDLKNDTQVDLVVSVGDLKKLQKKRIASKI